MDKEAKDQAKNRQAESAYVRKVAWGYEEPMAEEEMGDTILGDVTHPTPIVMPQTGSQWPLAVGMVLATLVPTAGAGALAAYLLMDKTPSQAQQPAYDDSSVSIGLGKIEDYLSEPRQESGKE